ncbi:TonB-dependent receptor [uncultured Chitinophaga sp.]|uniref:TonB-dependent receptor n=1 Tax=uncultured Chitinophaga sp. TaxID=339340 RepID=UPI0025EFBE2C|nr:TonB-dependent receptor [uncultured Chitinophaga sp.]
MKNYLHKYPVFTVLLLLFSLTLSAQTPIVIKGKVTDKTSGQGMPGVSVSVKGAATGAVTDANGSFTINTSRSLPLTLVFTSIGYSAEEQTITSAGSEINVSLTSASILGQEVVVSASRVPESILQSPVSIEKMDLRSIRATPAATFYDGLANLKGVEMSTQSLTFKSVNTRGFNSNANTRLLQLIDGMDNQAPGLNFSVGNIVGITELDMDNVELLPGAASALYGPNALNGIVLLNSKSPFTYQGFSANVKGGLLAEKGRSTPNTGYYDVTLRYAKAFNNKFAFKINFGYISADDWQAYDQRDQSLLNGHGLGDGSRANNPGYNGINTYGDETNINMKSSLRPAALNTGNPLGNGIAALSGATGGLISREQIFNAIMPDSANSFVSRTGYNELDVADYHTKNLKLNAALHYKFNNDLEAILQGSYGYGTTVYTGADRYAIRNFNMGQYKAELRGKNFYVRLYTTQERAGDSYSVGILASGINERWKASPTWFQQYFGTYAGGALQAFSTAFQQSLGGGASPAAAFAAATTAAQGGSTAYHNAARGVADNGRLMPGTDAFNKTADSVKQKPIPGDLATGLGARLADKTNLYQAEFMYNFTDHIKFMELMLGGNYRVYALNSEKTLFAVDDNGDEFRIQEYGGFVQVGKKLFEEHLKLSAALRYDKNENFDGQFSPRISAVYTFLRTHNFRASYQTGFRIPTCQDQYIDLRTPQYRLIGGLPFLIDRYGLRDETIFTAESVQAGAPQPYTIQELKPEKIYAYEVGYKGLYGNKLLVDAYVYFNNFKNFNGSQAIVKPSTSEIFSMPVSFDKDIRSWGWAIGLDYSLPLNFFVGGNVSYNELSNEDELGGFITAFNTPKIRYNLSAGNRNIANSNISFNVAWRWQDEYLWQSTFVSVAARAADVSTIPAYGTLDAQVSKFFPQIKTTLKIGAANALNNRYIQSWGNPTVGTQAYVSLGYNL